VLLIGFRLLEFWFLGNLQAGINVDAICNSDNVKLIPVITTVNAIHSIAAVIRIKNKIFAEVGPINDKFL